MAAYSKAPKVGIGARLAGRTDVRCPNTLRVFWPIGTPAAMKRLFVDRHLVLRAIAPNDSTQGLPGRCPPQRHAVPTPRRGERPVTTRGPDAPLCDTSLATCSVANVSISEVPGSRRALSFHRLLRFWQAGLKYPPRLARDNRDLPHGGSLAVSRDPQWFLAVKRNPPGPSGKGDVMIRRLSLVAGPAGSEWRTRRLN